MSNAGSNVKKATKNIVANPLKSAVVGLSGGVIGAQTLFAKETVDAGFEAPAPLPGDKALTFEEQRKRQVLRSREEILQQRRRAPGRTQTILTRRD
jgi:hypothetical protein